MLCDACDVGMKARADSKSVGSDKESQRQPTHSRERERHTRADASATLRHRPSWPVKEPS